MSDGLVLPVGADLTGLNQAFSQISATAVKMGQRINASMDVNQAAFNRLGQSTIPAGNAFQGLFSRITSGGAAAVASISASFAKLGAVGGLGAIGAGVGVAMKSISNAAEMEGLETSFAPLLGGADKAQARIQELAGFAAATPFEMPEVARASRVLEVLTQGALSTGDGLRMVGDVAATTQQPFDELATWIGRLYDGLQNGRPVGEAMARLQELGVVSGDVRSRIEELQESGASGDEVWGVAAGALGRFSGAMQAQSQTWNGKLSTLKDNISMAMAEFGRPIMDAIKPYLDSVSKMAGSLGQTAAAFGQRMAESIKFISAAFSSGQVGALLGSSLKLGFINATKFLWRSLNGTFAAAGQYLIEYFKTGVEMIGILRNADFWKGMGNALIGVFLDAVAFFQKGLAAALEAVRPLAEMLGQGDKITGAKKTLNESAGILRNEASEYYGKGGDQLGPLMDQVTARLGESLKNIGDRFKAGFAAAGDLVDSTAAAAEVDKLLESIRAFMTETQAKIAAANTNISAAAQPQTAGKDEKEGKNKSLSEMVTNRITPQVMSLTRIGGGGEAWGVGLGGGSGNGGNGNAAPGIKSPAGLSGNGISSIVAGLAGPVRSIASDVKKIVKNTTPRDESRPYAATYS